MTEGGVILKEFIIGFIATFGLLAATDAVLTEHRKKKETNTKKEVKKNDHVHDRSPFNYSC